MWTCLLTVSSVSLSQVELTGSSAFDYIHPGDHVETAEQLGMKLPPGRGASLSQGAVTEDGTSSASSSSHSETPEPGRSHRSEELKNCWVLEPVERFQEDLKAASLAATTQSPIICWNFGSFSCSDSQIFSCFYV